MNSPLKQAEAYDLLFHINYQPPYISTKQYFTYLDCITKINFKYKNLDWVTMLS